VGAISVFNVEDYGASPTATASANTGAINAAARAAGPAGILYMRAGAVFPTNGTIVVHGPMFARSAGISYSGSGIAVQVGANNGLLQDATVELPRVTQAAKAGRGWARFAGTDIGDSIGVRVVRAFNCRIFVDQIRNFGIGLNPHGLDGEGCDYNSFFITILSNNKVNLKIDADRTAWVNENNFFGGRLKFDSTEGVRIPGTRQVEISLPAPSQVLNNHRFYGVSLEGDVPEFLIDTRASFCAFDQCRYEAASPRVRIRGNGAGESAGLGNRFVGGYDLRNVTFIHENGAHGTRVETDRNVRWSPAPGDATLILGNSDSSATPTVMGLNSGMDPLAPVGTRWSWYISAQHLKGKRAEDQPDAPRIDLDFTTGNIRTRGSILGGGATPVVDSSQFVQAVPQGGSVVLPDLTVGLVLLCDTATGEAALMALGGPAGAVLWQSAPAFTGTAGHAGTYNVFRSGGGVPNAVIQNLRGAPAQITVMVLKAC
jgi:hypothetical protein